MGRLSAPLLALLLVAASAAALSACGGGEEADLLPGTTADQIESNLTRVEELADEGDCIGAEEAVAGVAAEVEELQGVDLKLKAALQEGTAKLSEVVGRCEEEDEETEPTLDPDVDAEEAEDEKKPKKEKPEDEESSEEEEPPEADEGPELPPQSNGKGEENGGGEGAPPVEEPEEAPPSGGVGPGVGVE